MPSPLAVTNALTSTDYFLDAEQQWDAFGIHPRKLTSLSKWSAPVVDYERLESSGPVQVHSAFKPLFTKPQKKTLRASVPTHAVAMYVSV